MSDDDWKKAGVMIRYNANSKFVEVEPEGLNALLRDQARLEWLAKGDKTITKIEGKFFVEWEYHWEYTRSTDGHYTWRDAIDNAMGRE